MHHLTVSVFYGIEGKHINIFTLSFMAAGVFVRWGSGLCPDTRPVQPGMYVISRHEVHYCPRPLC